jgi:hypothetical protein
MSKSSLPIFLCVFAPLREADYSLFAQRRKGAKKKGIAITAFLLASTALPAQAQEMAPNMPGMDHGAMGHSPKAAPCSVDMVGASDGETEVDFEIVRPCIPSQGSGTSRLPTYEGGMHGVHINPGGGWMLMLHGALTGVYTDQSGPRGDSKAYVQSMAMLTAEHDLGSSAHLQLRTMMSLEPLMKHNGYPNLFATGEVAQGQPLIDRQHPHDLFMELAAKVDVDVSDNAKLFLYGGPRPRLRITGSIRPT